MAKVFNLAVVAPDKSVVETDVTSVVLPGSDGYFGVLADHLPLIVSLRPGLLEYLDGNGQRHYVYIGGGFAEVRGDRVMVLADEAALANDIEISRAEQDLEQARRALRGEESVTNIDDAVNEVEKAMQRLRAARVAR